VREIDLPPSPERARCASPTASQICFPLARVSPGINPLTITSRAPHEAVQTALCARYMAWRYEPF